MNENYELELIVIDSEKNLIGTCEVLYEVFDNEAIKDLNDKFVFVVDNIMLSRIAGVTYDISKQNFKEFIEQKVNEMLKDCWCFYSRVGEIEIDYDDFMAGLKNGEETDILLRESDTSIKMKENDFGIDR